RVDDDDRLASLRVLNRVRLAHRRRGDAILDRHRRDLIRDLRHVVLHELVETKLCPDQYDQPRDQQLQDEEPEADAAPAPRHVATELAGEERSEEECGEGGVSARFRWSKFGHGFTIPDPRTR